MDGIRIWWIRLKFRIVYPVNYTNNLIWLAAFNRHLKDINKIKQTKQ